MVRYLELILLNSICRIKLNQWFDGLSMLYGFQSDKKVSYFLNK
ncbi:hypothetical protein FTG_1419 [Francisella tularensis subsp. novicida FTG]|nr:hypothetical protein FTG_1419 [Francisella tularensis subsp. novicida FTG]